MSYEVPQSFADTVVYMLGSYGLNKIKRDWQTDIGFVFTVTLNLEIWPWFNVMKHPLVVDNNCVKYYPDPTWLS